MPQIRVQERSPSETCPLCRGELGEDAAVICEGCGTAFHAECDAEFGSGCPTAGCAATQRKRREVRITWGSSRAEPEGWGWRDTAQSYLVGLGVVGVMASIMILVGDGRGYIGLAKGALALSALMIVIGWLLDPNRKWS